MNLLTLRLGSRDRIHPKSPLLQRITCYIRRFRRYSLMFSRDLCPSLWLFLTTDKSVRITTYTCHSYDHPPLILLLQDTPKFSLLFREYFVPTALQFFATWIPLRIISRPYRLSTHPQLFMCFTMVFEILFDPPKFLSSLLLCNTCLLALWMLSICLAIFVTILRRHHFEFVDYICCECSQSSIRS